MPKQILTPIWNPQACTPKQDIMEGKYLQAELALDLYTIANGTAKPPYNTPESFFQATHPTTTLKQLLKDTLSHLAGTKPINPVLLFAAGFGGGKTHAMAAIYYATKNPNSPETRKLVGTTQAPQNVRIIVIDGSAYGAKGITRNKHQYKTLWADFLHQLGETTLAQESDTPEGLPDRQTITNLLQKQPTLILIDEIPKYLDLVKEQTELLNKVKHFIHTLTLAVCEIEHNLLIISVARDAYVDAADAVRKELTEAMNILNRKMQPIEPVKTEDVPHILKKRLFESINAKTAETTAKAYTELYEQTKAPDRFRRVEYQNRITETYPFHPELIDVLYERLSTLPKFQRTRGALRLLAHAISHIWKTREADTLLIHPHHIDLAVPEIVQELTTRIDEEKYANAIASDVYAHGGRKGKAQQKDEDYKSHFQAPLFRRTCNTIYLYSLIGAKEEAKGIDADTLIATLATPGKEEHIQYYRDQILPSIGDSFWFIEPIGNRYVFKKEPTENRIIDQESQNIPNPKITKTIYTKLQELFTTKGKGHFYIEIFPDDPSAITDDTSLKTAILNPLLGHTIPSEEHVPENVTQFILNRDARGNLRAYRNNTFLLAAREGSWETLRDAAARLEVARTLAEDPEKYGIPHDKKKNLQQKVAQYEATVNDAVRASFTYLIYATRGGKIEAKSFRPSGYGTAQPGQEILWHVLANVLHRATDEPLDPDYAKTEAWPAQAEETTTRAFYENIHKKTGIVLPENQSLFEQTLLEGIKRGSWVLIQQDKTYAPESLPSRVTISSDSRLLLPDEAGRQGSTDARGHLCPNCHTWPCQCGKKPEGPTLTPWTTETITKEWETFEPAPPKVQLEDLEKWTRREGIENITEARIIVSGTTDAATQFRNLVRLSKAGKKISTTVEIKARTYQTNLTLDATFRTDDAGLETPAAKILDDIGRWSLPEFEGTITLKAEKMPLNEIRELLKNTLKTEDPNIKLALEIKPKREK
jgi:ABC-type dipeptide/oligopeptide/nickel transport system ATPase subunit